MSMMGAESSYHQEFLEEKREEIQAIIKKRQRKAAYISAVQRQEGGKGAAMMSAYIGRKQSNLPQINKLDDMNRSSPGSLSGASDVDQMDALIEGKELLGKENTAKMRDMSEAKDIPLTERTVGRLDDSDDVLEKRLQEAKEKNAGQKKVTLKTLEPEKRQGEPHLETKRRADVSRNYKTDKETT